MSSDIECTQDECYWQIGFKACNSCWGCTHNTAAGQPPRRGKKEDNFVTVEDHLTALLGYLVDIHGLKRRAAFGVIHYLQEWTCCLPDTIEMCEHCLMLFDLNREGTYIDSDWEWDDGDDVMMVMPEEFWGDYHDECVPYRECTEKE